MPDVCVEAFECAEDFAFGGVKFLVDAQLPRSLAAWLIGKGHDVIHTLDLPEKNRTKDSRLLELCAQEDRTLITKDADFQLSYELGKGPPKLLLVTTGNIGNAELESIFSKNETTILGLLRQHSFLEVNRGAIIVHR